MDQQQTNQENQEGSMETKESSTEMNTQPTTTQTPETKNFGNFIPLVVFLVLLAGGVYWYMTNNDTENENPFETDIADVVSKKEYPAVVAKINGEEIPSSQFNESLVQAEQVAIQQGLDPADPEVQAEIENQAFSLIVNTRLLVQAANNSGQTATEAEIDEQIAIIENQFGGQDELQAQLDVLNLSPEDLREDISEQLIVDKYIKTTDEWKALNVTEEEVKAAYDNVAASGQELPEFDEVSSVIRDQLEAQKQQEITLAIIEKLKAEAEIEKFF